MPARAHDGSRPTQVLLIEADLNVRVRHEDALRAAGYAVFPLSACPDADAIQLAAVVVSDIPSFYWLNEWRPRGLPPVIVITDDEKSGVTACLCGAAAWVPLGSDDEYLLDTIDGVLAQPDTSGGGDHAAEGLWPHG